MQRDDPGTSPLELLAWALLAGLAAVCVALWAGAELAALLVPGSWSPGSPVVMPGVLLRLTHRLGDPGTAWPPAGRGEAPGAFLLYACTLAVIAVPGATALDLWRRRRAPRPSDEGARWASPRDLAPLVGDEGAARLPLGRHRRRQLTAEPRQSLLVVAPTQSGKTTALAIPAILRWPGPVIATSVKNDLLDQTLDVRRRLGSVSIFDPTGATGQPAAGWTPLAGCHEWAGARRIAAWLTEAGAPNRRAMSDGDFWYSASAKLLAPLLFAAARSDRTMTDVMRWLDTQEEGEVVDALEAAECEPALHAMQATWIRDERQRSSVYTTAETTLEAYGDPGVLRSAETPEITPAALLGGANSIYLCATLREQRRLRPIFVTLLQELLEGAYAAAARRGRPLDPPVLVVLDEVANIAPIPDLDVIASTCAGQGIVLLTVLQDLAQAYDRWGRDKADTIINNHRARLFGAGLADERTLDVLTRLLGDARVEQTSTTRGSRSHASTTTSPQYRPLLPGHALRESQASGVLLYGTLPPAQVTWRGSIAGAGG